LFGFNPFSSGIVWKDQRIFGDLAYQNFTTGNNFIKIRYNKTKADQDGEKIRDKYVYANLFNPLVCTFLALGIWLTLESKILGSTTSLFSVENIGADAPKNKYTSSLSQLPQKNIDAVGKYIRKNHANAHGLQNGSASYGTNGTTCPSSVASITNRGDWSMGAVLDVYWYFSKPGNHFIEQVLAGLYPNKSEFTTLLPHFEKEGNLMGDLDIKEVMDMMYHQILDTYNGEVDPTNLLLFVLASVIYHSAWLNIIVAQNPGHPLSTIPLLNSPELLKGLHAKMDLKEGGQVSIVTGIPSHIENPVLCSKLFTLCNKTLIEGRELTTSVRDAVSQVHEEKALENRIVTGERLKNVRRLSRRSFEGN